MTKATGTGRGGRRAGAGAPKRNKNSLRGGFRSRDPKFLAWWHSLTADQQDYVRPLLKAAGGNVPSFDDEARAANVVPFAEPAPRQASFDSPSSPTSPQFTHTQRPTINQQSNGEPRRHREKALASVLLDYGLHNASNFVEKHGEALEEMERVVQDFQDMELHHPEQVAGIVAKGPFLRQSIHETLAIRTGRLVQCPYCGTYRQYIMQLATAQEVGS